MGMKAETIGWFTPEEKLPDDNADLLEYRVGQYGRNYRYHSDEYLINHWSKPEWGQSILPCSGHTQSKDRNEQVVPRNKPEVCRQKKRRPRVEGHRRHQRIKGMDVAYTVDFRWFSSEIATVWKPGHVVETYLDAMTVPVGFTRRDVETVLDLCFTEGSSHMTYTLAQKTAGTGLEGIRFRRNIRCSDHLLNWSTAKCRKRADISNRPESIKRCKNLAHLQHDEELEERGTPSQELRTLMSFGIYCSKTDLWPLVTSTHWK